MHQQPIWLQASQAVSRETWCAAAAARSAHWPAAPLFIATKANKQRQLMQTSSGRSPADRPNAAHPALPRFCARTDPKDSSKLVCQPGYIYVPTLTGYTTPQCVPCESGFYSPGGRSTRCLSCGSGAGFITPQGAASASQCVCIAGFGGPGCKQCAPGTFSTGGRPGIDPQPPCQVCPEGSKGSTTAGAISSLQCGGCLPG